MTSHSGPSRPPAPSGRDVIAQFLPQSPFVVKLGIVADRLEEDEVRLRLPWDPSNVTLGDMVHGGAIATLADLTVMAAAWCGVPAPPELRGVTVSMALDYMAPARATDVIGIGRALRRGRSLVNCEAEIVDSVGTLVAKALATYKVG
ncbi:thioesterase [Mycobacterium intracellulare subsp. chimaera]|nr:thioesterase [Mycobacterium intracellulare subsp. chimaera]PBA54715.1 thioesterase [Mycobacterium intracellulare subsp. chimaera]PBA62555.1 thioesterase [Mycobacterium intracellulare subsp. chimaera]